MPDAHHGEPGAGAATPTVAVVTGAASGMGAACARLLHDTGGAAERADMHFRTYLALEPEGSHADEARGLLLQRVP